MPTPFPLPDNEKQRLIKLAEYGIFNTEEDPVLTRFVTLAAEIAGTKMSYFNLVGIDQLLSKAAFGAATGFLPRAEAFCSYTIVHPESPLIVSDLLSDARFAGNKYVTGDASLRFYAGFPVDADSESAVGSLCVLDTTPHTLTETQINMLRALSIAIESHLKLGMLSARWNALERIGSNPAQLQTDMKDVDHQVRKGLAILDLRRGIEQGEFINYYQPKINLKTNQIDGAEALVRWNHPTRGILQPIEFIPLLEESGLIIEVGLQVFEQAIADWTQWFDSDVTPPQIAVNVAALQFSDPDFIDKITDVIQGSGFEGASPLSVEITESSLISNLESIADALHALQNIGVPIALDDFGTGFSSLAYIATLPIDILKIDRSFVVKMTSEAKYMGLVTTIINLAHSLEMKVVAEGVETEEEAKMLKLLRCEHAQGYLYSKPVPSSDFLALLQNQDSHVIGLERRRV